MRTCVNSDRTEVRVTLAANLYAAVSVESERSEMSR